MSLSGEKAHPDEGCDDEAEDNAIVTEDGEAVAIQVADHPLHGEDSTDPRGQEAKG